MSIYSDKLAHVQVIIINCQYSIVQSASEKRTVLDDVMSQNELTTDSLKSIRIQDF